MVGAEDAYLVVQELGECLCCSGHISRFSLPGGEAAPGGEGVGVVGAEDAYLVVQELGECPCRSGRISRFSLPEGEAAPGGEGVGVVGAEDAYLVVQELGECPCRSGHIPRHSEPEGEVVPGGEGVGVVGAEVAAGGGDKTVDLIDGDRELTCCTSTVGRAEQNPMGAQIKGVLLIQGVFGVLGEGLGVGAQYLSKGGVAFEFGPGGHDGVGGGASEMACLLVSERGAGGALNELVNANGLVRDAGIVVDEAEPVQGAQSSCGVGAGHGSRFTSGVAVDTDAVGGKVRAGGFAGQNVLRDAIGVEEGGEVEHGAGQAGGAQCVGAGDRQGPHGTEGGGLFVR